MFLQNYAKMNTDYAPNDLDPFTIYVVDELQRNEEHLRKVKAHERFLVAQAKKKSKGKRYRKSKAIEPIPKFH